MATPHKGEHTKGETGSESWWTLLWCLWRPPSLPEWFIVGFSFFSALKVPCEDHTFKDSQQSVVHYERAPTQELVFRYPHCTGSCTDGGNLEGGGRRMSFIPEYTFMAAGVLRVVFVLSLSPYLARLLSRTRSCLLV